MAGSSKKFSAKDPRKRNRTDPILAAENDAEQKVNELDLGEEPFDREEAERLLLDDMQDDTVGAGVCASPDNGADVPVSSKKSDESQTGGVVFDVPGEKSSNESDMVDIPSSSDQTNVVVCRYEEVLKFAWERRLPLVWNGLDRLTTEDLSNRWRWIREIRKQINSNIDELDRKSNV